MPDLTHLSVAERILVVEQIWDSIAADQAALPLSAAQQTELDYRLQAYQNEPSRGASSWEEVKARIQSKR